MFKRLHAWCDKFVAHKANKLFIDGTLMASGSYLTLNKLSGWTVSPLITPLVTATGAIWLGNIALGVIVYASAGKILAIILETFPHQAFKSIQSDGLNHCCLRINNEIEEHLSELLENVRAGDRSLAKSRFVTHHAFRQNIGLIVQTLHEHLRSTLTDASSRDIFISVYHVPEFWVLTAPRQTLSHLNNYKSSQHELSHLEISLDPAGPFQSYECVKCIVANEETHVSFDCSTYARSTARRHKTVEHYIGMKIRFRGTLLGFLNIEIHNKRFFTSEDEMVDYVETQIVAFRYMIEYQFLKKVFFQSVATNLLV